MDTICFLQVADNFEELYREYRRRLEDAPEKPVSQAVEAELPVSKKSENGTPLTVVENGNGFFKFFKEGPKIKIGGKGTRPFLFLQSLCDPFGTEKTVEQVFETIKIPSDANDQDLKEWAQNRQARMVQIIRNSAIKELQKIKELQGKLFYKFNPNETRLKLQLEE
jgi:hypothetical protein